MKKILFGTFLSLMLCLFLWSPSSVKADTYEIGTAWIKINNQDFNVAIYSEVTASPTYLRSNGTFISTQNPSTGLIWYLDNGELQPLYTNQTYSIYVPTLTNTNSLYYFDREIKLYSDYEDYEDDLPEELQPADPNAWDYFYLLWDTLFGTEPLPGSFIDNLRKYFEGDRSEDTEIVFPSSIPTPTPAPTPTPIPVQTIFVPDGNGNTTIIYQYPDPTTGVITQSPYNPNVTNNIEVNCDCDGGSGGGNNPFSSSPQDPYTLFADLNWGNALGAEFSDNPLSVADDSQTTLKGAAEEYTSSVEVMSNSFNVLPVKWLTLVGLLGGLLILAGLLRTFLGG